MGISASFAVVWLHSAEIFPTPMRNAGMGICSMAARVGGVMAPFATFMGDVYPKSELLIFGSFAIAAGLLNTRLPETKHKPLPECVDDMWRLKD
uniref:Major facilitator superfamily (MFS) profile domain-containing protein n=1 Tax=Plectus sambesii TaxID=2011161 RepID=A0A914VN35_9BILA